MISGGYAETPCAATPWSPAKITSRTSSSCAGGTAPWRRREPDGEVAEPAERPGGCGQPGQPLRGGRERRRRRMAASLTGWRPARAAARAAVLSRYSLPTRPVSTTPIAAHMRGQREERRRGGSTTACRPGSRPPR